MSWCFSIGASVAAMDSTAYAADFSAKHIIRVPHSRFPKVDGVMSTFPAVSQTFVIREYCHQLSSRSETSDPRASFMRTSRCQWFNVEVINGVRLQVGLHGNALIFLSFFALEEQLSLCLYRCTFCCAWSVSLCERIYLCLCRCTFNRAWLTRLVRPTK